MAKERKALLVHYTPGGDAEQSLATLNAHLADDWVVTTSTALGGAGSSAGAAFVALVVLERDEKRPVRGFSGA